VSKYDLFFHVNNVLLVKMDGGAGGAGGLITAAAAVLIGKSTQLMKSKMWNVSYGAKATN
jgi:hypothetical protein